MIKLLGHTKIRGKTPGLNTAHGLLIQVHKTHILAAAVVCVVATNLYDPADHAAKLRCCDWLVVVDGLADDWFSLHFICRI